jgi:hypothetical protein
MESRRPPRIDYIEYNIDPITGVSEIDSNARASLKRNFVVKQITYPREPSDKFSKMGSSYTNKQRSLRRPPRASTSMKSIPAVEKPNEPVQVISVNGRIHNHIGSQSSFKNLSN